MTRGENKAITVEPFRVLRVVPHDLVVEHVTHRGATHGQTRVTRIRLLDGIDRKEPDRVHRFFNQRGIRGGTVNGLDGGGGGGFDYGGDGEVAAEGDCGPGRVREGGGWAKAGKCGEGGAAGGGVRE